VNGAGAAGLLVTGAVIATWEPRPTLVAGGLVVLAVAALTAAAQRSRDRSRRSVR
jgi:NaMN:DMB phosphoribosyltransferase